MSNIVFANSSLTTVKLTAKDDLKPGEVFAFKISPNSYYMKTNRITKGSYSSEIVDLNAGGMYEGGSSDEVILVPSVTINSQAR